MPVPCPQKQSRASSTLSAKSTASKPRPKRTSSPVATSNIPTFSNSIPRPQTPRLTKRTSVPVSSSRAPTYHKLNPAPADWPKPQTVHCLDTKARPQPKKLGSRQSSAKALKSTSATKSAAKVSKDRSATLSSETPSIPPLPSFHPLYPNPHLEACTPGGLTHVLDCGHKIITSNGPESCGNNCKAVNETVQHADKNSRKSMVRTADKFCCTKCISSLLDKKYTKKYMNFLNELEGIRATLGELPERLVEQRREALQRVWLKEREGNWTCLTSTGRRCQSIDAEIELSEDIESTITADLYDSKRPTSMAEGSSLDEGVQLTYRQLLNRFPGPPCSPKEVVEEVEPVKLVDSEDHMWVSLDQRIKKASLDIFNLASRIHECRQAELKNTASPLLNIPLFGRK